MFTGIITDLGQVRAIEIGGDTRFEIATAYDTSTISIGASIACSGACLSAIEIGADWFAATASAETLSRTTLGAWQVGTPVNLERPLVAGQEMGGHIVLGHVDGVGRVTEIRGEGDSLRFSFEMPAGMARYVAEKGSIAVDGVSLTVNEVGERHFGVNIISHTAEVTNFRALEPGDSVNLEIDPLARYVARLLGRDSE
jgi:riboflavin synthase